MFFRGEAVVEGPAVEVVADEPVKEREETRGPSEEVLGEAMETREEEEEALVRKRFR